ncbi:reverse transcriptase domain-containing protein, partial [Tanacetum coccineum]
MVNKFPKQKELLPHILKGKEEGALRQSNEFQAGLTLMPRAWRLYLSKEAGKEGSSVALLAGLVASAGKGMEDLHVFIDSKILVDQVEGSRTPVTEEYREYKKEIMDAAALFHRFWITHLPKKMNSKAKVLTGLATIKLEFLNQEVLVGIKTRPSVEVGSDDKEGKATSKERIFKKRTKNEAKMTKSDTEWKSVEKTKSSQSP